MDYSDNFIPAMKIAFGDVNYINLSDHFKQRWESRKRFMPEETICRIIADGIAYKPLEEQDERFTLYDWNTRTRIICEQKPFRLPEDKVGKLINMITII